MSDSRRTRWTLRTVALLLSGNIVLAAGASSAPDAAEPAYGAWLAAAQPGIPLDPVALRLAIDDMAAATPALDPQIRRWRETLDRWEVEAAALSDALARGDSDMDQRKQAAVAQFMALQREALLSHPCLDFDRLLVVRRSVNQVGLPQNWQGNCALPARGYDNEIAVLTSLRTGGQRATLLKPADGAFVGDVDLHADATRMLFSSIGTNGRWQIFEVRSDGTGLRQVTLGDEPDVDNYDPCYLPDGCIMFCSTRCFQGVPWRRGRQHGRESLPHECRRHIRTPTLLRPGSQLVPHPAQ